MAINKTPVRIRKRKIKNGESLYLDIYVDGKRHYEYLNLYLTPGKTELEKITNKKYLDIANSIKLKRENEIFAGKFKVNDSDDLLVDFLNDKLKNDSITNAIISNLNNYGFANKKLKSVDDDFLKTFEITLLRDHKILTVWTYMARLNRAIKIAVEEGIIKNKPKYKIIKKEEVVRNHLSVDEIKILTEDLFNSTNKPKVESAKKAFIFSCLTGIRFSDIFKMKWSDISDNDQFLRITFRQKKTSGLEYLDINDQSRALLEYRKDKEDLVFRQVTNAYANRIIATWCEKKLNKKNISFHCARHTFAIMMLNIDIDLYTVSKLLGHRNIQTTQTYARIVDKKKQEAIQKIPNLISAT